MGNPCQKQFRGVGNSCAVCRMAVKVFMFPEMGFFSLNIRKRQRNKKDIKNDIKFET